MGLYPPFIPSYNPRDWSLDEWEIAVEEDVKKQFIDEMEKEQLRRYNLIGLYYYQYEEEYNEIINKIFEKHMWANFGVLDKFLTCKMCKKPILIKETIPPARRAATTYYNHTRALTMVGTGLCPRCKSNPDIFIKFIEKSMGIKLSVWQTDIVRNHVRNNIYRIKRNSETIKHANGLLGARFKCSSIDEF